MQPGRFSLRLGALPLLPLWYPAGRDRSVHGPPHDFLK
ncbi:MAG: hypothetical protein AVDCRST_MAG68-4099 [uncultured Gemmatimonadetes bacterium]|uniref:Uncharacterized protein n=1 Tax=uncultured Gemmatimonadota bacterium TaxID=203437 RepID=A0A6J4MDV0_9BACT|nr:MAG: hypothetical protein AVDCRST_MAG68-4099 [uncultured Gemmatimonadota bacterium]